MGRRSARLEQDAFVVETPGLVVEASRCGWEILELFVDGDGDPDPLLDPVMASGVPVARLAPGVLERVATTESPRAALAVVRRRVASLAALDAATFVVVGDRLADPGNVGTILRSAEAAGADAVVLTTGSVDVFNPKVVRASAGALFHVPVVVDVELAALAGAGATGSGRRVWGTSSHRGTPYTRADLRAPLTLVLGNETHGLDDDAPVDEWLVIPHAGRAESLNVAMAATVLVFEVRRQRGGG